MPALAQEALIHVANGTLFHNGDSNPTLLVNGTLIQIQLKKTVRDSQLNELLYVIIVIMFYATALMTLIITQIKRQRREGVEVDYYDEYLQRNSQVKKTCHTATEVLNKTDKQKGGRSPRPDHSLGFKQELAGPSKLNLQRERSPILESIPDEGT
ncbi:hypothetical protein LOTGIDRAFT_166987 [Lottia gigantea]|uniref:Uncharacterized protein n=1 Tax=Lottia gigantea TaxID=225164 RepID=V4BDJ6_LOTGI|nr:hypothetical protein LOTGIDRAFT_166987 [Lottia gigantea]ESO86714.1 hypothetical protein LOTGIDRAFT_166987 [Lottia gigantea]